MRLTLRTLLAYLDDLLEPSDARELGGKVRDSEFASSLVHRIRSVMGRLRLSAPNVLGRGVGADANSVAEYLDNTFPADRVPEFEKVCLESDMHLAEVASCHHVLTLVLGEPAQVSTRLRERIHGLPPTSNLAGEATVPPNRPLPQTRVDPPLRRESLPASQPATREAANVDLSAGHRRDSWRGGEEPAHVPDYVSAGRRRRMPTWLVALLSGFVVTAAAILGTLLLRDDTPQLATVPETNGSTAAPLLPHMDNGPGQPADIEPRPDTSMDSPAATTPDVDMNSEFQPNAGAVPLAPSLFPPAAETGSSADGPNANADPNTKAPLLPQAATNLGPASETPAGDNSATAREGIIGAENETSSKLPLTGAERPGGTSEKDSTVDDPTNMTEATTDKMKEEPVFPPVQEVNVKEKDLGRFVSEDQVVAVWNEVDERWLRLPPRSALLDGIHLRVPTLYRPQLVMGNGVQITLNDVSDVQLTALENERTEIKLDFGQAIVATINGDPQEVVLNIRGELLTVKLVDGLSQFAVEVRWPRLPGINPLDATPRALTQIWPTGGSIEVQRGNGSSESIGVGNVWVLSGQAEVRPIEKLPQWISAPQRKEIDRLAQFRLANELDFERELTLSLAEAAAEGPPENRSLAARSLASLDRFDPLLESFADPKQHFAWTTHFQALLDAISRNPQTAKLAQNTAQQHWGADFERMWEMVVGYDRDRLKNEGANRLVSSLADENLAVRVLAIETLRSITGVDYFFEPQRVSRRRDSLRRWQRELEAGRVEYKVWPPATGT